MIKEPIYSFNDVNDRGIYKVPVNNVVLIDDVAGVPRRIFLYDNTGIPVDTTIDTFLNTMQAKYEDLDVNHTTVEAAGAVMEDDTTTVQMQFVIDEDDMVSDTDTKVPTQQSVRTYVDVKIASALASEMTYKGAYDAATNTPNLDATPISTAIGDMYTVKVAGTFFTTPVEVGDVVIAEVIDATLETQWTVLNKNLEYSRYFDGTFVIENTADETKELKFDLGGLTTSTVRVATMPDADIDLVGSNIANVWNKGQSGAIETLTYAATVNIDLSLSNRQYLVLTGDSEIGIPTNIVPGQGGVLYVAQDATGSRALTFNAVFKPLKESTEVLDPLTTNVYSYEVFDATNIVYAHVGSF